MADSHAKHHDYHLVNPSPWPVVGSLSALVLAIGAVQYFHFETPWVMIIGLAGVLYIWALHQCFDISALTLSC